MNQLLHYLSKMHEREWDIKKSLEDNASKLILTSGIIIPIFFGLVLISDRSLDVVQIFFLLSVIFFGMMSIRYAINLIKPTSFPNIVDVNKFIDSPTGQLFWLILLINGDQTKLKNFLKLKFITNLQKLFLVKNVT